MPSFPAVLVTTLIVLAAPAPSASSRETPIASCIERVSQGRPWLARTLWGLRDQEGGWVGAAVRNANGSEDLGPLQVNSRWVGRIATALRRPPDDVRLWLRDDGCFNVDAARWIFLSALRVTGDYWKAIGVYHSPVGWRQARYSRSVADHLVRRFGTAVFASEKHHAAGTR